MNKYIDIILLIITFIVKLELNLWLIGQRKYDGTTGMEDIAKYFLLIYDGDDESENDCRIFLLVYSRRVHTLSNEYVQTNCLERERDKLRWNQDNNVMPWIIKLMITSKLCNIYCRTMI